MHCRLENVNLVVIGFPTGPTESLGFQDDLDSYSFFSGVADVASSYFLKRGEQIRGPTTLEVIKKSIAEGNVNSSDELSGTREGPWQKLGELPTFSYHSNDKLICSAEKEAKTARLI